MGILSETERTADIKAVFVEGSKEYAQMSEGHWKFIFL